MKQKQTEAIAIYWNDLTASKQQEILDALVDNHNYDVFPLAEIVISDEKEEMT